MNYRCKKLQSNVNIPILFSVAGWRSPFELCRRREKRRSVRSRRIRQCSCGRAGVHFAASCRQLEPGFAEDAVGVAPVPPSPPSPPHSRFRSIKLRTARQKVMVLTPLGMKPGAMWTERAQ